MPDNSRAQKNDRTPTVHVVGFSVQKEVGSEAGNKTKPRSPHRVGKVILLYQPGDLVLEPPHPLQKDGVGGTGHPPHDREVVRFLVVTLDLFRDQVFLRER